VLAGAPDDIQGLAEAAGQFQIRLAELKAANCVPDFDWYPYDSFGNLAHVASMLREERRDLLRLAAGAPVLDIGCGDGDLSFFFESFGCRAKAVDHPDTNYNRTLGFRALRTLLGSSAELHIRDVDGGLEFQNRTYGLALCLGVLYHLKNPYFLLETLARHARYCLLSTRIAQVTPRGTPIAEDAVAYLLGPREANNDLTNYWIFSEGGLRRILERTGWEVCDYAAEGFDQGSDPVAGARDQRAYCMIRSKLPDPWLDADLEEGWHAMENHSWRWTARVFAVTVKRTLSDAPALHFRFHVQEAVVKSLGRVRLQAKVAGFDLPAYEFDTSGEHTYLQQVPPEAFADEYVTVRFELDKVLSPTVTDDRELGVQVVFWAYENGVPRGLCPISIR
jgi:tRNA (mo5U34)-methyltransferase